MKKVMVGNHAVSLGVKLARAEVISAYPITPQTQIVEMLSEMCGSGELDARFIKVESEHSAMAACMGASATGVRTFTATSSQGLALMHELLHWAGNGRHPIVMANVNRAMGPGWNIWTDQNDSLSQRDTGWIQLYCETNQEVLDTTIQAFKLAEIVDLPVMIILDAFFLSHTSEPVDVPEQELVDEFLPRREADVKLDTEDPRAFGALVRPDDYMEMRWDQQEAMERARRVFAEIDADWRVLTGRGYGALEAYRAEDAELILVTSGTITSTAREVVDRRRDDGERVGLVKVKMFRPFPTAGLRRLLSGADRVAVLDRNVSPGHGGIFAEEIRSALYDVPLDDRPRLYGYVLGLGGRDVRPETIDEIIERTRAVDAPAREDLWVGVKA
ncbi:MAG: pyruvate ferredoxin oxidoreductase [Gemmatimonadetes bacterium]|nr:pyruvate ferredoxin oxidoreductase [Gemmatimonadota bacterium]NIQ54704.1 pyruvate ferredoxin oxidoreductase [Gemmatimonadota bacterium]NIU74909.1 pyruvate ferredoxin oxidoreductase [Gammaproteobacteria bacterium]NIX44794.1 pyruvate ferredoxin oxidoreductase [Gemmatimonadota bacterium]NIY09030.1 pyruvate ferredoxin oxidoreductase [Gemmatimonadota bacterium]